MASKNIVSIIKVSGFALLILVALIATSITTSAAPGAQKSGPMAPEANAVPNWGFETGNATANWTTAINNGTRSIEAGTVHSGIYSVRVLSDSSSSAGSGIGGGGSCSDGSGSGSRIPVTGNTAYTWNGWTYAPTYAQTNFMFARVRVNWYTTCVGGSPINNQPIDSNSPAANDVWAFVTGSGTSPATALFAQVELVGRYTSGVNAIFFDDIHFDRTVPVATPAVDWTYSLPSGGSYLAAPGVAWEATPSPTPNTLIFVGGNSGSHLMLRATATTAPTSPMWSSAVGTSAAIQNRASIININGTDVVFFTSQDGCVKALRADNGNSFWSSSCVKIGQKAQAGVGFQRAQSGGPGIDLIFAATNADTITNTLVALNASTGAPVWYFGTAPFVGLPGTNATIGPILGRPLIAWAPSNTVYFGSNNLAAAGGGIWAVNSLNTGNGAQRWARTAAEVGTVSGSTPVFPANGSTLYIGTDDLVGGTRKFRAINPTTGVVRASYDLPTGSNFFGSAWPNTVGSSTDVYFTYGNRVYALTDNGGATFSLKSGFGVSSSGYTTVPGGSTPLLLSAKGSLFMGGNDGAFYKMNMNTGAGEGRIYLLSNTTAAVSDPTYDFRRDAFYITANNRLYSIRGNWAGVGTGPMGGGMNTEKSVGGAVSSEESKPAAEESEVALSPDDMMMAPNASLRSVYLFNVRSDMTPPRSTFSAASNNWMYVQMKWFGLQGEQVAHVTFYSPDGKVYQVVSTPFMAGNTAITTVWGELPVAGTYMGRTPGEWKVQVRLGDSPKVYGETSFTLAP